MLEEYFSQCPEETRAIGRRLADRLEPGAVLALHGDLGAGKTCLVQGLAEGLGSDAPVCSPTFTLVQIYPGRLTLNHIDLYRVHDELEAWNLGLDEYLFGDGVTAIEWPERAADLLPPGTWIVQLAALPGAETTRRITIQRGAPHKAGQEGKPDER
ncbi:MAG: tRNA (adenosine(37)-N6)-threonylcarbamoyltransferase complex ATPase subunit type 1 TsaE [Candidatus Marinimicrobia bacterium]|nr:tRNA (adenosine(37)-N6)-threonylcarbamoyltransferase complex ATPase subunit type 1 TsaE [Candidatus Neomarinimicrobiota bacterium]